jgi:predicted Zn-dependent peptidase
VKLLATLALAAAGAAIAQAPAAIPKVKYTDTKLDNGLRVIVSEDHYAPVYAIVISYKVGSRDEVKGRTGFAHLFEHMMFKGSENVGVGELDYLISTNGGSANGTTNTDRTSYYETLPKNQLDLGLFLEADRMRGLVLNRENLENQRQAVKEERRLSVDNQAYGQTSEKLEELVYDNFAYHHSVIGSMEDLDAATVEDVKRFFKTYYAPNNAVLALAGDLDTKDALAKVKKYFGSIPRQEAPQRVDLAEPPKNGERRATITDKLARLPRIGLAYRIPPSCQPASRALSVAASILGGGQTSRLYQKLVQEKEVVSQVSSRTDRRGGPGMFSISATVRPGQKLEDVEALITEEVAKLASAPVDPKELQRVRMSLRRSAVSRIGVLSRAQELADAAAVFDNPERVNTEIDAQLAVTAADIQKAWLTTANRVSLYTLPGAPTGAPGGGRRGGPQGN